MNSALWLLLWLRVRGWGRRLARGGATLRGALLLVVGALCFSCIFFPPLVTYLLGGEIERPGSRESLRRFGPFLLAAYCVMTVLFSSSERAITFTPAEVHFLFPAPFTRRQLLGYKLTTAFLACLVTGAFLTVVGLPYGNWPIAAFVGLVLSFFFLNLFTICVTLLAHVVGAHAYNRGRRVLVLLVLAAAALSLILVGADLSRLEPTELADELEQSPVVRTLLAPLGWFIHTITARQLWPDLLLYGALSALVNGLLVFAVLKLDAHYLEASTSASERVYELLQRVRRGGTVTFWRAATTAKLTLPSLPWLGGVGPIAWRQLVTALRGLLGLQIFLGLVICGVVVSLSFSVEPHGDESKPMGMVLAIAVLAMSLLSLPAMVRFDFRGDVDHMDVLKSVPLGSWSIAAGQLVAPVVLLSTLQIGVLVIIQLLWGGAYWLMLGVIGFAWPINWISIGVDNLLFLLFPSRAAPQTAGDFQAMGRQMIMLLAKAISLGVAVGFATLPAVALFLATRSIPGSLVAAWMVLALFAAALVPLVGLAFERFDVTRDTPP